MPITSSICWRTRSGSAAGRSILFSTGTISWSWSMRLIDVGQGLGLDALAGVHHQDRALAGGQRAADLIGEVDVAGRVHQVQHIVLAVVGAVVEPHGLGLDGDAALALDVHGVEHLLLHLARGQRRRSPGSAGRTASTCRGRCGRRWRSCGCGSGVVMAAGSSQFAPARGGGLPKAWWWTGRGRRRDARSPPSEPAHRRVGEPHRCVTGDDVGVSGAGDDHRLDHQHAPRRCLLPRGVDLIVRRAGDSDAVDAWASSRAGRLHRTPSSSLHTARPGCGPGEFAIACRSHADRRGPSETRP